MTTKLKHVTSGVVIEVADKKVARLGGDWISPDDHTGPIELTAEAVTSEEAASVPPAEIEGADVGEGGIPVLAETVPPVEPKRSPGRPKKAPASE